MKKLKWKPSEFSILNNGLQKIMVNGYITDYFGIHVKDEWWNLVHLPSGAFVNSYQTLEDVKYACKYLLLKSSWDWASKKCVKIKNFVSELTLMLDRINEELKRQRLNKSPKEKFNLITEEEYEKANKDIWSISFNN